LVLAPAILLALGILPVVLVCLREGTAERAARRAVAARLGVGLCLVLAAGASIAALRSQSWTLAHKAVGKSSLDDTAAWLDWALSLADVTGQLGLICALAAVVLLAVLGMAPLGRLLNARSLAGLLLVVLMLVPVGVGRWLLGKQASQLARESGPLRAAAAARVIGDLPQVSGGGMDQRLVATHVVFRSDETWFELKPGGTQQPAGPLPADGRLALVLSAQTPATELVGPDWGEGLESGETRVLQLAYRQAGQREGFLHPLADVARLGGLDLHVLSTEVPETAAVAIDPDLEGQGLTFKGLPLQSTLFIADGPPDEQTPGSPGDIFLLGPSATSVRLTAADPVEQELVARARGGDLDWVVLIPGEHWTVGDLVDLCRWATDGPAAVDLYADHEPILCAIDHALPRPQLESTIGPR
jgi:hypothetical protein